MRWRRAVHATARGTGRLTLIILWVVAVIVLIVTVGLTILAYTPPPPVLPPDPPPTSIPGLPCCTTPTT